MIATLCRFLGRGLALFIWAALLAGCNRAPAHDYSALARALTDVRSAVGVGVNLVSFSDLVRKLASEVSIAEAELGPSPAKSDADTVALAKDALAGYVDSLSAWRLKVSHGAFVTFAESPEVKALAQKYKVPIEPHGVSVDPIVMAAWRDAGIPAQAALIYITTPTR